MHPRRPTTGFTLIELLIVVAIIAILAAIAVPNFLEAQTRAKVARVRADMRTVATAMEMYYVDRNNYPPMVVNTSGNTTTINFFVPNGITTPIAYLASKSILLDVFKKHRTNIPAQSGSTDPRARDYYNYINSKQLAKYPNIQNFSPYPPVPRDKYSGGWELWGYGPDLIAGPSYRATDGTTLYILYDPTNGTVSGGDIRRSQKDPLGKDNARPQ